MAAIKTMTSKNPNHNSLRIRTALTSVPFFLLLVGCGEGTPSLDSINEDPSTEQLSAVNPEQNPDTIVEQNPVTDVVVVSEAESIAIEPELGAAEESMEEQEPDMSLSEVPGEDPDMDPNIVSVPAIGPEDCVYPMIWQENG